jgi:hypothetical protein
MQDNHTCEQELRVERKFFMNILFVISACLVLNQHAAAQNSSTTYSSSNSTVYVDEKLDSHSSSSFSISSTDYEYTLIVHFPEEKTNEIKAIISRILEEKEFMLNNSQYFTSDSESIEIKLYDGKLQLFIDKEIASRSEFRQIQKIEKQIKEALNS